MARYTVHTPDGPKRKTIYDRKYREVERKLAEAMGDAARGIVYDDENMTVSEYLDRWLSDSDRGTVRESTYSRDKYLVTNHIKPSIGRIKLKNVSALHLQRLYRDRLDAGLSGSTVQKMHHVIHKALSQAVRWDLIPRNPAGNVKAPTPSTKEMHPLSADEARQLLEAARDDRLEALYVLALHTGMRRGELLGLKWDDVDLDNETIRVRRTLTRKGTGYVLGEPKTRKSRRIIRLTTRAVEALSSHRTRRLEEKATRDRIRRLRACIRGRGRQPHQPFEPPSEIIRAAPNACGSAADHLPRSAPHMRIALVPEERPSEVRAGAIRTRLRIYHPRYLLPHAARHGRRGRRRDR